MNHSPFVPGDSQNREVIVAAPFFVAGGTVPPGAPSYVARDADGEIFEALIAREFCYVLNSRQMGKSSLAVRAMARLVDAGVRCAIVDLTKIGSAEVSEEQWYVGILAEVARTLGYRRELVGHLKQYGAVSPNQRLLTFLQEVVAPRKASGRSSRYDSCPTG